MFFKRALILIPFLVTANLSCTPKVGESAPSPSEKQFSGTACLTDATKTVELFLAGDGRDSDVRGAWDCFASAFEAFEKYVRGSNQSEYSPAEISSFIEREFIARRPDGSIHAIPPSLQVEFMKIKQLVTGGSATSITRSEIRSLIKKVELFKALTLRLNPHMKILLMKWQPQGSLDENASPADLEAFEGANRASQDAARQLGSIIQENQGVYRLDDAVTLLTEISSYLGSEWELTASIARFMPLAKKLKKSLTGGQEDRILASEWRLVLVTGLRSYVQFLRYHYFVELPQNVSRQQRLTSITKIVEEGFSIIEDLVRQKSNGAITRSEIDEIASVAMEAFPEVKTSDVLINELMKIKQLLFGGTTDRIAATDFEKARLKVSRIRDLFDQLSPYSQIFAGEWKGGANGPTKTALEEFGRAETAMDQAAKDLGQLLEGSGQPYDLKSLTTLMKEWRRLYPKSGDQKALVTYLPLLQTLKNMIYGDSDSLVRDHQWPSVLAFGSKSYMTALFYAYFLKDRDTRKPGNMSSLTMLLDRGISLVQELLDENPKKAFSKADVTRIIAAAGTAGLLPDSFNAKTLSGLMDPIMNRFLNPPEKRLAGQKPNVIRQSSLVILKREFMIWAETATFIAETFDGSDSVRLSAGTLRGAVNKALNRKSASEELRIGLTELASILDTNQSFVLDEERRLFISGGGRLKYNYWSVERHNMVRAVARLFHSSYANDLSRIRRYQGVTLAEAKVAFKELGSVAVRMGLLEPGNTGFMDSRFREANLFMPSADGNSLASFKETQQIMFSIMSGLVLDAKLKTSLRKACGKSSRVAYSCLQSIYRQTFRTHLSSMPDLLVYQSRVDDVNFSQFMYDALKGSGWAPSQTVTLSDASLMPHLLQYIELIYARFDGNRDGGISASEAYQAFPLFKPLFLQLAAKELADGSIKEKDLFALFTYILRYGRPPSGIWEGLTQWFPWRDNPGKWQFAADRGQLANILAFIVDQSNGVPVPPKDASEGPVKKRK